ncbi:MAG: hypothetical protein AB7O24_26495 [Kofleriaceae bacterium]
MGDSIAWVIRGSTIEDLTEGQARKPLVGAGCIPRRFRARSLGRATLLVASAGLWKYGNRADIARIATGEDLDAAAHALVEVVRVPAGVLQDDVSVVLCRDARRG